MIIKVTGTIFACKLGEKETNRYTIITRESRDFRYLNGTACIIETSQEELLKTYLQSDTGINLARALGIDDQRISRMRNALGIGYTDGGNRRTIKHEDPPSIAGRLKAVGHAAKKVIIMADTIQTWQLVPKTQIILDPLVKPFVKRWIEQSSVDTIAKTLQIGKSQVTELKRLLGELKQ